MEYQKSLHPNSRQAAPLNVLLQENAAVGKCLKFKQVFARALLVEPNLGTLLVPIMLSQTEIQHSSLFFNKIK